jgi:hypothetical protein
LPSVFFSTLGKDLGKKHSAKKLFAECFIFYTWQRVSFFTLGKEFLCRVFFFSTLGKDLGKKHSAKKLFAECFIFYTWQRVSFFTLGKEFLCRVFYFGY